MQGVVGLGVHGDGADGDQLAQHATQLCFAVLRAQTEGAEGVVTELGDLVGALAAHNVHDVARAKADAAELLHAVDGGEQLAGGVGAVPNIRWGNAVIAIPARC